MYIFDQGRHFYQSCVDKHSQASYGPLPNTLRYCGEMACVEENLLMFGSSDTAD